MIPSIVTELRPIQQLEPSLLEAMFVLLERHFINVTWPRFMRDLLAKDLVILLRESRSGRLLGFSTQKMITAANGARVVFSGDTIIAPDAWGTLELPKAWGRWMLSLLSENPESPLYWLLISKGHRTYRLLPSFFNDYAPGTQRGFSSNEIGLVEEIGGALFGEALSRNARGHLVVRAQSDSQALRPHLRQLRAAKELNPQIAWFLEANPNYAQGEELVCLARFALDNVTPFYRDLLGEPRVLGMSELERAAL